VVFFVLWWVVLCVGCVSSWCSLLVFVCVGVCVIWCGCGCVVLCFVGFVGVVL
jgi:hypothetical protein